MLIICRVNKIAIYTGFFTIWVGSNLIFELEHNAHNLIDFNLEKKSGFGNIDPPSHDTSLHQIIILCVWTIIHTTEFSYLAVSKQLNCGMTHKICTEFCCALFCCPWRIHAIHLPIFFNIAPPPPPPPPPTYYIRVEARGSIKKIIMKKETNPNSV